MSAIRIYNIHDSVVFRKTKEEFGGLSNMAAGFSIYVNEVLIPTSEHLYQACRFPDNPKLQWDIINEKSPMRAKWIGRAHITESRKDWDIIQFKIMQWALELKLSQNWDNFSELLKATSNKNIVESTPKPKIWGAVLKDDHYEGVNALGRLLMHIRELYVTPNNHNKCVPSLDIPNFYFLGYPIGLICDEHDDNSASYENSPRKFVFT